MIQHPTVTSLLLAAAVSASGNFRLVGESWSSLVAGSENVSSRTVHSYDDQGRLASSSVFTPDTSSSASGRILYSYDAIDRRTVALTLTGTDTLGRLESIRDPLGRLVETRNFGPKGVLSYIDSFSYDGDTSIRSWQVDDQGVVAWIEIRDSVPGELVSDTLFERAKGTGFVPTRFELSSLDRSGRALSVQLFLRQGAEWTLTQTKTMSYSSGSLAAVATYVPGRDSKVLSDSASYSYDQDGNLAEERWYDAARSGTDLFRYRWESNPTSASASSPPGRRNLRFSGEDLVLPGGSTEVRIQDLEGRILWNADVRGRTALRLPSHLRHRMFVVTISNGWESLSGLWRR